jgi:ABC-type sugar transport system ATPase subunit
VPSDVAAISCKKIGKRFGATQALAGVSLDIRRGTVHALVGENGAGKSTCLGIIGGRISPSEGTVSIFGSPLHHGDPRASRKAGVAVIYQELTISPHLSAQANVFLGQERHRNGVLSGARMRREFLQLCKEMEVSIRADATAGTLSVADRQMLEIMRALIGSPRIILFDEPTASLAQHERDVLFRVMRDLRSRGVTLALVSHNLDEVLAIADEVTVFRNGVKTASQPAADWDKQSLVDAMLGPEKQALAGDHRAIRESFDDTEPLVKVRNLTVPGVLGPIDFELWRGEILGVGGVVGSGRTTLLNALAGLVPKADGELWIAGRRTTWPTTVRAARRLGISLVPEDRQAAGLFTKLSSADNITISNYSPLTRLGLLSMLLLRRAASKASRTVGFADTDLSVRAAGLSGGNQQKLILARWQHSSPTILLCDEPTRGIDIGAKAEVMASLRDRADHGLSIVLVSSELEEIQDNADRAIVLTEGSQSGEVSRAEGTLTVKDILHRAFRAEEAS